MALAIPDTKRCQAEKPTGGPFVLGGPVGDPKNGYRVRCSNTPTVIATENEPGEDGAIGWMSLCDECQQKMIEQLGPTYASFEPIPTDEERGKS